MHVNPDNSLFVDVRRLQSFCLHWQSSVTVGIQTIRYSYEEKPGQKKRVYEQILTMEKTMVEEHDIQQRLAAFIERETGP